MEIEFTKPTPEAAELQALFNQTDKETILHLTKELTKAQIKAENLEEELETLKKQNEQWVLMADKFLAELMKYREL